MSSMGPENTFRAGQITFSHGILKFNVQVIPCRQQRQNKMQCRVNIISPSNSEIQSSDYVPDGKGKKKFDVW